MQNKYGIRRPFFVFNFSDLDGGTELMYCSIAKKKKKILVFKM